MSASERRDTFGLSGFFALRTPLLAFDELRAWSDGLQAPQALDHPDQVDAALAADRAVLAERLLAVWRRPEVREAVFLASPELDAALERLTGGAAGEKALARAGRLLRADGRAIDALWLVCRVQRRRPGHVNHARAAGAVDVWPPHAAGHGLPRRAGECLGNRPSGASDATLSAQFESLPRGWPPSLRGVRPLPEALAVFARLAAASAEAVDRGDFRLWPQGASGPSGALLLGRFCHADPDLHRRVVDHLRAEEAHQPDVAFAEIVHLPEGRLGNILSRPLLRDYEIPFLGQSGATCERQIPATDLRISVRRGRIVLRSERLDREVVPRLTTAHNFGRRGLGLYRFLCALQPQGTRAWLGWSWGPLDRAPFLPRVQARTSAATRQRCSSSPLPMRRASSVSTRSQHLRFYSPSCLAN